VKVIQTEGNLTQQKWNALCAYKHELEPSWLGIKIHVPLQHLIPFLCSGMVLMYLYKK